MENTDFILRQCFRTLTDDAYGRIIHTVQPIVKEYMYAICDPGRQWFIENIHTDSELGKIYEPLKQQPSTARAKPENFMPTSRLECLLMISWTVLHGNKLASSGFANKIYGGFVRDILRGREPNDIDAGVNDDFAFHSVKKGGYDTRIASYIKLFEQISTDWPRAFGARLRMTKKLKDNFKDRYGVDYGKSCFKTNKTLKLNTPEYSIFSQADTTDIRGSILHALGLRRIKNIYGEEFKLMKPILTETKYKRAPEEKEIINNSLKQSPPLLFYPSYISRTKEDINGSQLFMCCVFPTLDGPNIPTDVEDFGIFGGLQLDFKAPFENVSPGMPTTADNFAIKGGQSSSDVPVIQAKLYLPPPFPTLPIALNLLLRNDNIFYYTHAAKTLKIITKYPDRRIGKTNKFATEAERFKRLGFRGLNNLNVFESNSEIELFEDQTLPPEKPVAAWVRKDGRLVPNDTGLKKQKEKQERQQKSDERYGRYEIDFKRGGVNQPWDKLVKCRSTYDECRDFEMAPQFYGGGRPNDTFELISEKIKEIYKSTEKFGIEVTKMMIQNAGEPGYAEKLTSPIGLLAGQMVTIYNDIYKKYYTDGPYKQFLAHDISEGFYREIQHSYLPESNVMYSLASYLRQPVKSPEEESAGSGSIFSETAAGSGSIFSETAAGTKTATSATTTTTKQPVIIRKQPKEDVKRRRIGSEPGDNQGPNPMSAFKLKNSGKKRVRADVYHGGGSIQHIIDPISFKKYNLLSKTGIFILKNYIKSFLEK